jgi:uncharacterized protein YcsI (UPF0317 family)
MCPRPAGVYAGTVVYSRRVCNALKKEARNMPIVQRFAQVFGAIYVLVGVAGFFTARMPESERSAAQPRS